MAMDLTINRVAKLQSPALDENNFLSITLVRDDGAEVVLQFTPELLFEFLGMASMASKKPSIEESQASTMSVEISVSGTSAFPAANNDGIVLRLEDKDGVQHDFAIDENRGSSFRVQIRRAIEALRTAKAGTPSRGNASNELTPQ